MKLIPVLEHFSNPKVKIIPKDTEHRYHDDRKSGSEDTWAGNFELPGWRGTAHLYNISDHDKIWTKDVKLKDNEKLFRYDSTATRAGKMEPIVKINVDSGIVYFMSEEGIEKDEPIFDKKGTKVQFLNLKDGVV